MVRVLWQTAAPDLAWAAAEPNPGSSPAPYRIYNIGNNQSVTLEEFIHTLEQALGKQAARNNLPMQPGDVLATYADISDLNAAVGFQPSTSIKVGIERFVSWYRAYYQV